MKNLLLASCILLSSNQLHSMQEDTRHSSTSRLTPIISIKSTDVSPTDTPLAVSTYQSGTVLKAPEFVTIDLNEDVFPGRPSLEEWGAQLKESIKATKSAKLIDLLSSHGQPVQRGFSFQPYTNALDQIRAHKDKEVRILTNTAEPSAKYFKCCNMTYVWNRHLAPGIIVVAKLGQLGFAAWGIYRAASLVLQEQPTNYLEAAANAAPAIGSILSSCGDLPFSLISAHRRRILKTQQAKYEYYVLAEHNVETYEELTKLVRENQTGISQLLAREVSAPAVLLREHVQEPSAHNNNTPAPDDSLALDEAFGDGYKIGKNNEN